MKLQIRPVAQLMSCLLGAACLFGAPSPARSDPALGVTKDQILLGSIQDLSGPIMSVSSPLINGMIFRMDAANAAGGVNGRKLRLVIEDSGYDPKRGVLAAQKLLSNDNVFAMIGTAGTSIALATAPSIIEAGVPQLFPAAAARETYDPFQRLRFAMLTPYEVETRAGLMEMLRRGHYKRVAILYQDEAFGLDVLRATEGVLAAAGMPLVEKTSYKRGATDFSSQAQRLVGSAPDLVVLGAAVRETVGAVTAMRQLGFKGDFLGTQGTFHKDVPGLGGAAVEGLYSVSGYPMMYRDNPDNSAELNAWMDAYKARFGRDADQYSATGWVAMDIFIRAATAAGPDLTVDRLVSELERTSYPRGFLGNPAYSWSPTKRLGGSDVVISQIRDGRWHVLSQGIRTE